MTIGVSFGEDSGQLTQNRDAEKSNEMQTWASFSCVVDLSNSLSYSNTTSCIIPSEEANSEWSGTKEAKVLLRYSVNGMLQFLVLNMFSIEVMDATQDKKFCESIDKMVIGTAIVPESRIIPLVKMLCIFSYLSLYRPVDSFNVQINWIRSRIVGKAWEYSPHAFSNFLHIQLRIQKIKEIVLYSFDGVADGIGTNFGVRGCA